MRLAVCESRNVVRPLSEEEARRLLERYTVIRREAVKWRKMTGRDGTLILLTDQAQRSSND